MRIVCIADTHEKHQQVTLPDGDLLIHAGDFTFLGEPEPTLDFLDWFENQPFKYKVLISGNHDFYFEHSKNVSNLKRRNFHYLMNNRIAIENKIKGEVNVWGSPFTPEFMNWAFMESREKISSIWDQIPPSLDVLVTHGPPFGILDRTAGGLNVGCSALLDTIQTKKPKLHVFGHIHEGYGVVEKNKTIFVNASLCNEYYNLVNEPVVVDL